MPRLTRLFDQTHGEINFLDAKGRGEISGESVGENKEGWEFRVSIFPSRKNVRKAAHALETLYESRPDFPSLKLYTPKEGELKDQDGWWGPYNVSLTDKNQLGKECCVYIDKDRNGKTALSKEEYIELMVAIWAALDKADVDLGYVVTPVAEKAVICDELGVMSPICYSSAKPWRRKHGTMVETSFNPEGHEDPLKDVVIPVSMLKKAGVTLDRYRLQANIPRQTQQIQRLGQAVSDWSADFTILQEENFSGDSFADELRRARRLEVDWGKKDSKINSQTDHKAVLEETLADWKVFRSDLNEHFGFSIVADKEFSEMIDSLIAKNPHAMQKLYRRAFHISREFKSLELANNMSSAFIEKMKTQRKGETALSIVFGLGYTASAVCIGSATSLVVSAMQVATQPMATVGSAIAASNPDFAILASIAAVCLAIAIVATVYQRKVSSPKQISFLREQESVRQAALEAPKNIGTEL